MKDTFLSARLVKDDLIRLVLFSALPYEKFDAILVCDRQHDTKLNCVKIASLANVLIADYHLDGPLELGHSYAIVIKDFGLTPLDVSEATTFPDFDEKFYYDGNDLGAVWGEKETHFALWAPLASSVLLRFKRPSESRWHYRTMERGEKGVYRLTLHGEFDGLLYHYLVTNSELTADATDPYAKGSTPNGQDSVVVATPLFKEDFHREALPILNSYTDAVIYEGNVRDLTIDKHTDIVHKGTYAGLAEKGRKTSGGNPAGFDYLSSLGITHLQLQPIYDFKTVDELHPEASYNWGYDPAQYFVPEGSYASNVLDPKNRLMEVRQLVASFHLAGIRVVQDVVFNHVYEYLSSVFEKVVPNFFFRRKANGRMANTSYCGDDVASERPMVRKLIVDACKWWIDFYGIDGFRFDLMGILDIPTLKEIADYGKSKDPSFIVYGEGWNMGSECSWPLGNMDNAKLLPDFAFFNDRFREGGKHFLSLDHGDDTLFSYALISSSLDYGSHHPLFLNANQSVNYLECHDNATLFDYLSYARPNLSLEDKLALCESGLTSVFFAFGIPFVHAGEEIGQSKWGKDNTYNLPDIYNKFSYRLLDERKGMVDYFRSLVAFRKKARYLHAYDPRVIAPLVDLSSEGGALHLAYADPNELGLDSRIDVYLNPSDKEMPLSFKEERVLLLSSDPSVVSPSPSKTFTLKPHASLVLALRKKLA